MPDGALETVVEQPIPPVDEAVAEPAKEREPGLHDEKSLGPAGGVWDGHKWVNPVGKPSRFAEVRKSLEQSQRESEWRRLAKEGNVKPDESQDPETWAFLRNKELAEKTNQLTPPDFGAEKTGEGAEGSETAEQPLTAEQIEHNSRHQEVMTRIWARYDEPEVASLKNSMLQAAEAGATPKFFNDLGYFASDHANGEEILFDLGKHPEKLTAYTLLTKEQLANTVRALSRELDARGKRAQLLPKPKPPDPVGARATATAFDVNDDKLDPEEWARQRNEQVAKRRGR